MRESFSSNKGIKINYLYFICFFLFLIALTFFHFLRFSKPFLGIHLFFLFYALGQALLEVFCFMLLGYFLHRWIPRGAAVFTGLLFLFALAHFANFTMVRLMDATLSYVFKCFFGSGLDHVRVVFQALNLNSTIVAIILGSILFVPLIGIFFYWITQKLSVRKPLLLSSKQLFCTIFWLGFLLLLLDVVAHPYLTNDVYRKYQKALPLGLTFLSPPPHHFSLPQPIKPFREEKPIQELLSTQQLSSETRPNIYLFVIETLRRDFVNEQVAPEMSAFARRHLAPEWTFANANSTFPSWFAIFHSCYPYYWTHVRDHWLKGSVPLQLLKKMGYRIRVYSSADLNYFSMDQVLFGKNRELVDSIEDYSLLRESAPYERDALAMQSLSKQLEKEQEGTLFLIFLDSTHSEYSAPPDFQHFQPAASSIDYLAISNSPTSLELLKNRYRNSIHWVDHLMGHFFDRLHELNLYDDALIALTGDHAEEFFEEGALFHGTHLNDWQTKVPLFYKFPGPRPGPADSLSTHLDLFPSILHFLTGKSDWSDYFDGQSLFARERWPYVLRVQPNGSDVPYEFSLSNRKTTLLARFLNPPQIHTIPSIELLALETPEGRETSPSEETVREHFNGAFLPLIQKVFIPSHP